MKAGRVSPGSWFLLALLYAILMAVTVTTLAMRQPWMGLSLQWEPESRAARVVQNEGMATRLPVDSLVTALVTDQQSLSLAQEDFTAEPASGLLTLTAYDAFLERQGRIATLLRQDRLQLQTLDGTLHPVTPSHYRPFTELPLEFWVQIVVGFFAWLISAGVWIFRREDASARYLLLSGFSTSVFTSFAAVYSTRELALPTELFRWLCDLNFLGGTLYCVTMAALLWYYPRRLGRFPLGPWLLVAGLGWWLMQEWRLVDSMVVARRFNVFACLLLTFALGFVQWLSTRRDPVARAALQWFLLSWLVGISLFALLNFVPQLFGMVTGELQGYSFLLFLLVYGGLAFGILRFRLFELGDWWFRILTWIGGVLLLLLLDIAFLWGLNLSSSLSLGLALLLCGLLWLPFRGWLWGLLMERYRPSEQNLFNEVLAIAFANHEQDRHVRWQALAQRLFDPLHITLMPTTTDNSIAITRNGLEMSLPGQVSLPALKLEYAGGGRRLFTPRDRALAEQVLDMLRHANDSRDAYNQGAREERSRIARDLHDDIGSRLLTALHHSDLVQSKAAVSQGMMEMQTIIRGLTGQHMALEDVIAELRHEIAGRLEAAGIGLDWPMSPLTGEACRAGGIEVGYSVYKNYLSLMRELIANIIRHAGARQVSIHVHCEDGVLASTIRNDGLRFNGVPPDDARGGGQSSGQGNGLNNLKKRLQETGGQLVYHPTETGAHLTLTLPLQGEPS